LGSAPSDSAVATRNDARVAIGAGVGTVSVSGLCLARDIHYSGPPGVSDWEAPQPLTAEQWFVLGDNVSVSVDSRRWSSIEASSILGPVRHRDR
jgi:type IV secretory pathway protease TraF